MAEQQVLGWGTQTAPAERRTKASEVFELLSIEADFDGTAAAGSWVPAVQVISDAGQSVGVYTADDTLTTGDTATVTFAPFLGKKGNIRFGRRNIGNWLDIETTGSGGPASAGINFVTDTWDATVNNSTLWNLAFTIIRCGGNPLRIQLVSTLDLEADTLTGFFANEWVLTGPTASVGVAASDEVQVALAAGQPMTVFDSGGNPIFRVNENGDLQGKTGKALTFNL